MYSLTQDKAHEILVELLRVGLVRLRNLGHGSGVEPNHACILCWLDLLHSIPPLLHTPVHADALRYLFSVHGSRFLSEYPSPSEVEYSQVKTLLTELRQVAS